MRLPRRSPRVAAHDSEEVRVSGYSPPLRFMILVVLALAHAGVALADVVQVPVDSLLNGRPVTTLTGGRIVTWTAGVDDTDGLMTEAAEAYLDQTGTALPDDGTFPTNSRHPEIVLHFSNDASATSSQALSVPDAGSFAVPVPVATYSSVYLVFTSSYGASALTVTMNYVDGSSVVTNVTVPDWATGAPADDPVLFDLISGMHKWTNQNQEVNTPSHTLTGVELTAEPGKVLTAIQVEKPNAGQLLISGEQRASPQGRSAPTGAPTRPTTRVPTRTRPRTAASIRARIKPRNLRRMPPTHTTTRRERSSRASIRPAAPRPAKAGARSGNRVARRSRAQGAWCGSCLEGRSSADARASHRAP